MIYGFALTKPKRKLKPKFNRSSIPSKNEQDYELPARHARFPWHIVGTKKENVSTCLINKNIFKFSISPFTIPKRLLHWVGWSPSMCWHRKAALNNQLQTNNRQPHSKNLLIFFGYDSLWICRTIWNNGKCGTVRRMG